MPNNTLSWWARIKNFFRNWTLTWIKNLWSPKNQDPTRQQDLRNHEKNDEVQKGHAINRSPGIDIQKQSEQETQAELRKSVEGNFLRMNPDKQFGDLDDKIIYDAYLDLRNTFGINKKEEADKFLEDKMEILNGQGKKFGCSILHHTIEYYKEEDTELLKYLLNKKINTNAKNFLDDTPLHLTTQKLNSQIIVPLVANGADLEALNNNGLTPLFIAVKSYLDCRDIDTEEKKEIVKEYKNTIDTLVANGANLNTHAQTNT